jgi:hypothetical protein
MTYRIQLENSAGAQQTAARGIAKEDGLVKSRFTDGFAKSSKFKAQVACHEAYLSYAAVTTR